MGFFLPFIAGLIIGNSSKSCDCDYAGRAARNAEWSRRFEEKQRRYAERERAREREKREQRIDFLAKYGAQMQTAPTSLAGEMVARDEDGWELKECLREHYPAFVLQLEAARKLTESQKERGRIAGLKASYAGVIAQYEGMIGKPDGLTRKDLHEIKSELRDCREKFASFCERESALG